MYKKVKGLFSGSEFFRNVLTLATGTALAQALPILISPILTRLYSPEQFATFGLFSALVSILGVISTGKYEYALLLPKDEEQAKSITVLAFLITCTFGGITLLIVLVFHNQILVFFKNPDFSFWIYLVPLGITFTGCYQILNFWNNRNKSYKKLAKSRVARAFVSSGFNLIFGFIKVGVKSLQSLGLIVGLLIGQAMEVVMLCPFLFRNFREKKNQLKNLQIKAIAKRYINFPRYDVPSELMVTTSLQLPVLLLNRFFSQSTVGLYFHAHRILSIPLSMVGSAIGQVLFKQLSDCREDPTRFSDTVKKTYSNLALLAIVPFSVVGCFGEEVFGFVFGSNWAEAGVYASLISPWLFFNFIGSPLTIIFSILEKQKHMFFWVMGIFLVRAIAVLIGVGILQDVYYTVLMFSIGGAVSYFLMNFYLVSVLSHVPKNDFIISTFGLPLGILVGVLFLKLLTVL